MPQDNKALNEKIKQIDESYQYYRDQLTATLTPLLLFTVALLGAFLNQNKDYFKVIKPEKVFFFNFGFVFLIFAVIFTLVARLLIFYGYKAHANKISAELNVEKINIVGIKLQKDLVELENLKNNSSNSTDIIIIQNNINNLSTILMENKKSYAESINSAFSLLQLSNKYFCPAEILGSMAIILFLISSVVIFSFIIISAGVNLI